MNSEKLNNLYGEVINSPEFKRLHDISFLGILGYLCADGHGYSSRYEHSVAVANKCFIYARKKALSEIDEAYLVLAGLLHDIGHSGFSHSIEPVSINKFSISHHTVTKQIILFSPCLVKIWNKYNINADRIIDTIEGNSNERDKLVTKMSINFDTLDGIVRTEKHFLNTEVSNKVCEQVFNVICNEDDWQSYSETFDLFWKHKERIYSSYIYNDKFRIVELLFQELLMKEASLHRDHFLLSDSEMQREFPWVNEFVNDIKANLSLGFVYNELNAVKEFRDVVEASIRRFRINFSEKFSVIKNQRYFVSEETQLSYI